MERALVGELLDEVAQPKFAPLTREQLRLLRADRDEFFASLGPELMAWKRWAMNAPDWYLAKYAYGVDIKRKLLQLDYERAFPAPERRGAGRDARAPRPGRAGGASVGRGRGVRCPGVNIMSIIGSYTEYDHEVTHLTRSLSASGARVSAADRLATALATCRLHAGGWPSPPPADPAGAMPC